jgi:hypothetical protein
MRHPILCVAGMVAPLALLAPAGADTDVFVLAGQSNMLGRSTQNEGLMQGRVTSPSPDGLVSRAFRLVDHRWALANEFPCHDSECTGTNCTYPGPHRIPSGHPQWTDQGSGTCVCSCGVHLPALNQDADVGAGSPWPRFAELWMSERGRAVEFVATARGGTCLVGAPYGGQPAWDPDAMDCSTLPPVPLGVPAPTLRTPGELYCRMLEAVALAEVEPVRAVLWMQGECDATAAVPQGAYRAALERFADAVWRDLGAPVVVAPISRHTRIGDTCVSHPQIDAIHDATIAAVDAHPYLLLGPNADDLELEADCVHVRDVVTFGARWFDAVTVRLPQCRNGLDDDGDGFTDLEDPACGSSMSTREDAQCQDGRDNDGDGRIDFDGGASRNGGTPITASDRECQHFGDRYERPGGGCGLGAELALVVAPLMRGRRRSRSLRA